MSFGITEPFQPSPSAKSRGYLDIAMYSIKDVMQTHHFVHRELHFFICNWKGKMQMCLLKQFSKMDTIQFASEELNGFEEFTVLSNENKLEEETPLFPSCQTSAKRDICESIFLFHGRLGLQQPFLSPKSDEIVHFLQNSQISAELAKSRC